MGELDDLQFQALGDGRVNHILVIVKGSKIAIYVNSLPVWYGTSQKPLRGEIWLRVYPEPLEWTRVTTVAFDNFKIWDISNLP
jgi:hypothetical protein